LFLPRVCGQSAENPNRRMTPCTIRSNCFRRNQ